MEELLGCGAAAGCARGIAKRLSPQKTAVERRSVENAEAEAERLEAVREEYLQSLQELMKQDADFFLHEKFLLIQSKKYIVQHTCFDGNCQQKPMPRPGFAKETGGGHCPLLFGKNAQVRVPWLLDKCYDKMVYVM